MQTSSCGQTEVYHSPRVPCASRFRLRLAAAETIPLFLRISKFN